MLVRNAESEDGQAIKINDRYSIINVLNPDPYPCELGETYPYHSVPGLFTPMSVLTTEDSGIGSLQNNPHLALYGHGVLVGLVDTGIDYRHPAFLTREGNSRIYSIWDQEDQNGISPEGSDMVQSIRMKILILHFRASILSVLFHARIQTDTVLLSPAL